MEPEETLAGVEPETKRQAFAEAVSRIDEGFRQDAAERVRVGWPGAGREACQECSGMGLHKYGCSVDAKRAEMQAKLESARIDETKLKDRTTSVRRTVEVVAHDVRRKLLERAEMLLDNNDLDNAVTLINAAKGLE